MGVETGYNPYAEQAATDQAAVARPVYKLRTSTIDNRPTPPPAEAVAVSSPESAVVAQPVTETATASAPPAPAEQVQPVAVAETPPTPLAPAIETRVPESPAVIQPTPEISLVHAPAPEPAVESSLAQPAQLVESQPTTDQTQALPEQTVEQKLEDDPNFRARVDQEFKRLLKADDLNSYSSLGGKWYNTRRRDPLTPEEIAQEIDPLRAQAEQTVREHDEKRAALIATPEDRALYQEALERATKVYGFKQSPDGSWRDRQGKRITSEIIEERTDYFFEELKQQAEAPLRQAEQAATEQQRIEEYNAAIEAEHVHLREKGVENIPAFYDLLDDQSHHTLSESYGLERSRFSDDLRKFTPDHGKTWMPTSKRLENNFTEDLSLLDKLVKGELTPSEEASFKNRLARQGYTTVDQVRRGKDWQNYFETRIQDYLDTRQNRQAEAVDARPTKDEALDLLDTRQRALGDQLAQQTIRDYDLRNWE